MVLTQMLEEVINFTENTVISNLIGQTYSFSASGSFDYKSNYPYMSESQLKSVIVGTTVTSIAQFSFYQFNNFL